MRYQCFFCRTFIVTIAILIFSMATSVMGQFNAPDGDCPPTDAARFESFEDAKYVVEIFPDQHGNFPIPTAAGHRF